MPRLRARVAHLVDAGDGPRQAGEGAGLDRRPARFHSPHAHHHQPLALVEHRVGGGGEERHVAPGHQGAEGNVDVFRRRLAAAEYRRAFQVAAALAFQPQQGHHVVEGRAAG